MINPDDYPPSDSPELERLRDLAAAVIIFAERLQACRDGLVKDGSHAGDQGGASCRTIIEELSKALRMHIDTTVETDPEFVPEFVRELLSREYP